MTNESPSSQENKHKDNTALTVMPAEEKSLITEVATEGGFCVGGNVDIKNGDFVGRDKYEVHIRWLKVPGSIALIIGVFAVAVISYIVYRVITDPASIPTPIPDQALLKPEAPNEILVLIEDSPLSFFSAENLKIAILKETSSYDYFNISKSRVEVINPRIRASDEITHSVTIKAELLNDQLIVTIKNVKPTILTSFNPENRLSIQVNRMSSNYENLIAQATILHMLHYEIEKQSDRIATSTAIGVIEQKFDLERKRLKILDTPYFWAEVSYLLGWFLFDNSAYEELTENSMLTQESINYFSNVIESQTYVSKLTLLQAHLNRGHAYKRQAIGLKSQKDKALKKMLLDKARQDYELLINKNNSLLRQIYPEGLVDAYYNLALTQKELSMGIFAETVITIKNTPAFCLAFIPKDINGFEETTYLDFVNNLVSSGTDHTQVNLEFYANVEDVTMLEMSLENLEKARESQNDGRFDVTKSILKNIGDIYLNLGWEQVKKGDIAFANFNYNKALENYEKMINEFSSDISKYELMDWYYQLGLAYRGVAYTYMLGRQGEFTEVNTSNIVEILAESTKKLNSSLKNLQDLIIPQSIIQEDGKLISEYSNRVKYYFGQHFIHQRESEIHLNLGYTFNLLWQITHSQKYLDSALNHYRQGEKFTGINVKELENGATDIDFNWIYRNYGAIYGSAWALVQKHEYVNALEKVFEIQKVKKIEETPIFEFMGRLDILKSESYYALLGQLFAIKSNNKYARDSYNCALMINDAKWSHKPQLASGFEIRYTNYAFGKLIYEESDKLGLLHKDEILNAICFNLYEKVFIEWPGYKYTLRKDEVELLSNMINIMKCTN